MVIPGWWRQCRSCGVRNPRVLSALQALPRSGWLPEGWGAYGDVETSLTLPPGRHVWLPFQVGRLAEALGGQQERPVVLVIGGGCGYLAGVCAHAGMDVVVVEPDEAVALALRCAWESLSLRVQCVQGPWEMGLAARRQWTAVMVQGALTALPLPLRTLVDEGVRVLACVGHPPVHSVLAHERGTGGGGMSARLVLQTLVRTQAACQNVSDLRAQTS